MNIDYNNEIFIEIKHGPYIGQTVAEIELDKILLDILEKTFSKIFSDSKTVTVSNNSNIGKFFCGDCKELFKRDLTPFIELGEKIKNIAYTESMFSYINDMICPHCGSAYNTFLVDDMMADIIKIIYDKGYSTYACCQGHHETEVDIFHSTTLPYIAFNMSRELLEFIIDPINAQWTNNYFEVSIKSDSIIIRPIEIIESEDFDQYKEWREFVIDNFKKFVNEIPDLKLSI